MCGIAGFVTVQPSDSPLDPGADDRHHPSSRPRRFRLLPGRIASLGHRRLEHHRSRRRPSAACPTKTARCGLPITAKSSITPISVPRWNTPATATEPIATPKPSSTPTNNTGRPVGDALPRHVRLRHLGPEQPHAVSAPATAWASSRSTTTGTAACSPSPPKSRRCWSIRDLPANSKTRCCPSTSRSDMLSGERDAVLAASAS